MTDDTYANTPVSIGEIRADKSGHAKDMTARDCLISILRDLDSGKIDKMDFVAICFAKRTSTSGVLTNVYVGGPSNPLEIYGLLERCKYDIIEEVTG